MAECPRLTFSLIHVDLVYICCSELQERRSLFEKKKNALLIALLSGDAEQEKEKMAELVAAGRLLRDAVSGQYQLHGQRRYTPLHLNVLHLACLPGSNYLLPPFGLQV
jgi:hypothetical protein